MAKYLHNVQMNADESILKELALLEDFSFGVVTDCFMLEMGKIDLGGIAKVMVHLTDSPQQENDYQTFIDVIQIKKYLEISGFLSLPRLEKKLRLITLIQEAVEFLAKENGIVLCLDEVVRKSLLRLENFSGTIGKKITKKDKSAAAQIFYTYKKNIEIACQIKYADGSEQTVVMFEAPPVLGVVLDMFGSAQWASEDSIAITKKNTDDYWLIDVNQSASDFFLARACNGQAHGMYDVGMMYATGRLVLINKEKAKFWLEKAASAGFPKAAAALSKL
ncbi:MAG TPA: hypothetical protein VIZ65_01780 [Cellvibrionaceae bacterium]